MISKAKATPYSNLKIFHHTDLLQNLSKGKRVAPLYIRIKPTNICNENCHYCHYKNSYLSLDDYSPSDFIPRDKMMEIIDDMRDIGVKAVTFSGGGEPLVYPYITETMQRVLDAGIDLSIITNGVLLKDENAQILGNAKWVRLSVDSSRDELYSSLRDVPRGTFEGLCQNIENFSKIKAPNCELGINCVVGQENYPYVYEMARLMKSLGVNHIKFSPAISTRTEETHKPFMQEVMDNLQKAHELEDENFRIIDLYTSDFKRTESGVGLFNRAYETCYMQKFICVIAANSKIYRCQDKAYLKNGIVADLKNQSFKDAWFANKTIQESNEFQPQEICAEHCVHDARNIMLNQFFTMDLNHINFI